MRETLGTSAHSEVDRLAARVRELEAANAQLQAERDMAAGKESTDADTRD